MKKTTTLALTLSLPLFLLSQEGELDLSFNGDGKIHIEKQNTIEQVSQVALQPDGKLLLIGSSGPTGSSAPADIMIYRLDVGGNPDPKFGNQGVVLTDFGTYDALGQAVAVQTDGKILAVGRATESGSTGKYGVGLVRLMPNGSPDYGFGDSSKVYFPIDGSSQLYPFVDVQPNGKIVVGGKFTQGSIKVMLARFNANGTPDYFFGDSAIATLESPGNYVRIDRFVQTATGNFAGVGRAYSNNQWQMAVVQFEADGTPDANFGSNGVALINSPTTAFGYGIAAQGDGKIVVSGSVEKNGLDIFALARLLPDGTLDQSFGINGQASAAILSGDATSYAVQILGDGKILAAGTADGIWNRDFALARFTSAGTLDKSFSLDGYVTKNIGNGNDYVFDAIIQPNGRVVLAGSSLYNHNPSGSGSSTYDFAAARFLGGQGSIGVNEFAETGFALYPNPATNFIQLQFEDEVHTVELKLMDQRGILVHKMTATGQEVRMELIGLSPGMYLLQVAADGANPVFRKVMVE